MEVLVLCVFDVNETLLDLAALDEFFVDMTGEAGARQEWFQSMIHTALTLTAAREYRPFGEIGATCRSRSPLATAGPRPLSSSARSASGCGSCPRTPTPPMRSRGCGRPVSAWSP
jgi:hypothetical protein